MYSDELVKRTDIEKLKSWIQLKLGGYKVAIKDIHAGNLFFRGVRWTDRPKTIDQLSNPPADKTSSGRCNREGQSKFYASCGAPPVFYEIHAKQGNRVALSQWKLTEPLWMHNLGYHHAALRRIGTHVLAERSALTDPIPNESKENKKLRRALSLAFTKDIPAGKEHLYRQSIAINELLFDKAEPLKPTPGGPKYDRPSGTVYPAMRLRGDADNIVLSPEFVVSSLRLVNVRYVLIEAADEAKLSYTFLTTDFADTFLGDEIIWKEQREPEPARRSHFALEDGRWVLRHDNGQIYDVH
jgi:hypothetical protein